MQNTGQYGVSDSPQFVVGRPPPAHLFSISHDNMSIAPPAGHPLQTAGLHPQQQQHHLPHHVQAQHHHYGPHPGHQPHPSLQQIHQTQSPHASHSPHPQFPLPQHAQAQQQPTQSHQQQQASPHPDVQQHQQVQKQQQQQQQQVQQAQQQQQQAQQAQQQAQQVQQQQQAAQQAAAHQAAQQAQQQAMVQQLGLGGPDSPEVPSPGVSRPSPTNYTQLVVSVGQQDYDGMEEEGRSTGGNRWPRQETLALIKIRSEMDANFRDSGLKGPLWEEVSRKLAEMGYQRNAKKCKEKFENVHKYYKKTKDGRAGRQDGKSYRFFSQLEALYGGQPSAAQLESNAAVAAAATVLTGTPMLVKPLATLEDYNVSAQRPSEVSTGVTLSESTEDDYDAPGSGEADNQEKTSKKRKRMEGGKSGTSSKLDFFEGLMKNLLDKQESMQKKFLEFMERREQERQVREEAWRRQEVARMAREHELRTQEHTLAATRDAALVAFLQKVTGQTLQLPQIPTRPPVAVPPSTDSVVAEPQPPQPTPLPATTPPTVVTPSSQALALTTTTTTTVDEHEKDSSIDPNSKRWPKPEVLTLIKLRSEMEPRFQEAGPKGPLWEEISQGMACLGHNRNQKRCKEKWENINKYFRKTKESNKKRPENAKTCPYFHQLDSLYRSGVLGTPSNKQQVVKPADSSPAVDHQALPLAHRFDAVANAGAGDAAEILKMLPAAAEAVQNAASSGNGTSGGAAPAQAPHFFSSPENGSSAERGAKPVSESSL